MGLISRVSSRTYRKLGPKNKLKKRFFKKMFSNSPSPTFETRRHHDLSKGSWSQYEDEKIFQLVEKFGPGKWAKMAQNFKNPKRTGKQCREQWHNHLNPDIKKCPYNLEEDWLIFKARE